MIISVEGQKVVFGIAMPPHSKKQPVIVIALTRLWSPSGWTTPALVIRNPKNG